VNKVENIHRGKVWAGSCQKVSYQKCRIPVALNNFALTTAQIQHGVTEIYGPPSATVAELSMLPKLQLETACWKQSILRHLWRCSESR